MGKGLKASKHVAVEEQVAIFLLIIGHDNRFRQAQYETIRSLETIHNYFHCVLKYVLKLGNYLIKPATHDLFPETTNTSHAWANTYFKVCVSVADGTFIFVKVSPEEQIRYRTRKGDIMQNVLVACSFNMKITKVLAG
ncbi:hypothetical protein GIB67_007054 [Kingdonia uniflora]|uniref:DUF8040 domain-containing protein n=1 Tax=Kingdonia uniflora TaxID=39325 RepID=A0A7J7NZC9_9MAGN|nr:hypothetical protein GIB67_007054 [Kingdonia uniflora]